MITISLCFYVLVCKNKTKKIDLDKLIEELKYNTYNINIQDEIMLLFMRNNGKDNTKIKRIFLDLIIEKNNQ